MKLNLKTPQLSLSKDLLRFRPSETDFNSFNAKLAELQLKIDNDQREDQQKTYVQNFLRDTFYRGTNDVNSKGTIDLAIHKGPTAATPVEVIIETKSPGNKTQMVSADKPNVKAIHELVLYFMRERVDENNDDLKYLIATNINEWFIFSASKFNELFYDNTKFRKTYEEWRDKLKVSSNTDHFYDEIVRPFIDKLDETIDCTYFDLRDYRGKTGERKLIALFKILSPYYLLKRPFADDSNTLDKKFYTELLHIIGLEEYKEKSKTLIRRKAAGSDGSLIEKAITKLESEYLVFDQTNWKKYGETRAEQISNAALELCIVWINRVLFLKLLESQLVEYHEGRASYKFLNKDKVNNFNELSRLFHDVLNCPVVERNQKAAERYPTVPYLNSSLFDHADVEIDTIRIHAIDDNGELDVPRASILRKLGETSDSLPTLEYLFRFLDAYDFASEGKEEVQKENRSLINASVLGKVFEKINGYKDGSIYTPGFITMYMCRQAIRLAVVQKFKDSTDFDGADFEELANWVKDRNYQKENIRRFNAVIDSLKICDPAVGSGHFLVSALNEILAIKSELKIFADADFNTFGDHTIAIANDELVITDRGNHLFEYRIRDGRELNTEMQRLQSTLFHEKQKLIENCLFGVDINPNSVKICRLRLWIELLKNAYYKAETRPVGSVPQADKEDTLATAQVSASHAELETLPNIDINIKEGNSLISRYKLQDKFKSEATNKIIKDYRELIGEAKNVKDRSRKDELRRLVSESKKALSKALEDETTKVKEKLDKKHARLNEVNHPKLFEVTSEAEREMMSRKIQKEIDVLEVELSKIEGKYDNSFEWRLEFPEILDDEGTFLGFDIVIGNPPYMSISKTPDIKGFQLDYKTYDSTGDILCLFYERGHRLLQSDGILCFITSNKWMRSNYGERLRQYFLDNVGLRFLFDFDWFQVFENASVDSNILTFSFAPTSDDFNGCLATPNFEISKLRDFVETNVRPLTFIDDGPWSIIEGTTADLKTKLSGNGTPISNWNLEINRGILTGLNEAFIIDEQTRNDLIDQDPKNIEITQPLLRGQDIQRYGVAFERLWLINSHNGIRERNIPPINVQRDYPSIFEYLQEFETSAKARADQGNHWTNLRNCAYVDQFQNPKIVWAETMRVHRTNPKNFPRFGYDDEGFVVDKTSFFGVGEDLKYLMAVLNSSVGRFLVKRFVDKLDSGGYMMQKSSVEKIPVKRIEGERQIPFIELVDRILELKKTGDDTAELENRIDQMVYDLYELTPDEKAIVEGS